MSFVAFKELGVNFAETSTVQEHELGTSVIAANGATYTYVIAGGTIALRDAVVRDASGTGMPWRVVASSAVNQPIVGVAQVAIASGAYGWIITRGPATVKVAASTAAGVTVGSSATAATLSTITIGGSPTQAEVQRVNAAAGGVGVVTTAAESSGVAAAFLS